MYKIIGADGREYGPISAASLKQWIAEGRANEHTKVLAEGGTDWKKLSDLPEFSTDLSTHEPEGSPRVTNSGRDGVEAIAQDILATPRQLKLLDCLRHGWELVRERFWLTVGVTGLMLLITVGISFVPLLGVSATACLAYVIWGGVDWMMLKLVRNRVAELRDAFTGFTTAFVPLLLFSIVGQLLTAIGFGLFILPGIYLVVAWHLFTPLLIMDKGLDFWTAMEVGRKIVTRCWWPVFGMFTLLLLVFLLGLMGGIVGVFIAIPVIIAAKVYAYEALFSSTPLPLPNTPSTPCP